jgi:hypothetical protein
MLGLDETLAAADAAAAIAEGWTLPEPSPVLLGTDNPAPAPVLDEAAAKVALARHGVPVPEGAIAATPEDAAAIATRIGFPVVLKGHGIAHKTEAGAVRLNLRSAEAVAAAAREIGHANGLLVIRSCSGVGPDQGVVAPHQLEALLILQHLEYAAWILVYEQGLKIQLVNRNIHLLFKPQPLMINSSPHV